MIPLGERHLRHVIAECIEHSHTERSHQGFGNAIPVPSAPANENGAIMRRERLGGMLSYYHRKAA